MRWFFSKDCQPGEGIWFIDVHVKSQNGSYRSKTKQCRTDITNRLVCLKGPVMIGVDWSGGHGKKGVPIFLKFHLEYRDAVRRSNIGREAPWCPLSNEAVRTLVCESWEGEFKCTTAQFRSRWLSVNFVSGKIQENLKGVSRSACCWRAGNCASVLLLVGNVSQHELLLDFVRLLGFASWKAI